jgi:hypothetical protein
MNQIESFQQQHPSTFDVLKVQRWQQKLIQEIDKMATNLLDLISNSDQLVYEIEGSVASQITSIMVC